MNLVAVRTRQHNFIVYVERVVPQRGGQLLAAEGIHGRVVIDEPVAGEVVVNVEAVMVLQREIVMDVGPHNPILDWLAVVAGRGVGEIVRSGEDRVDVRRNASCHLAA